MCGKLSVRTRCIERTRFNTRHEAGRVVPSRQSRTRDTKVVFGNAKGLSIWGSYAKLFCDRETNLNLLPSLDRYIKPQIRTKELDLHINSLDVAQYVHDAFQDLLREMR